MPRTDRAVWAGNETLSEWRRQPSTPFRVPGSGRLALALFFLLEPGSGVLFAAVAILLGRGIGLFGVTITRLRAELPQERPSKGPEAARRNRH
jgi:hypothetical protein